MGHYSCLSFCGLFCQGCKCCGNTMRQHMKYGILGPKRRYADVNNCLYIHVKSPCRLCTCMCMCHLPTYVSQVFVNGIPDCWYSSIINVARVESMFHRFPDDFDTAHAHEQMDNIPKMMISSPSYDPFFLTGSGGQDPADDNQLGNHRLWLLLNCHPDGPTSVECNFNHALSNMI